MKLRRCYFDLSSLHSYVYDMGISFATRNVADVGWDKLGDGSVKLRMKQCDVRK